MSSSNHTESPVEIRKLLLSAAAFALLGSALQHAGSLIGFVFGEDVRFHRSESNQLVANIGHLSQGAYFASFGQTRLPCDLKLDNVVIDSTKSVVSGLSKKASLGAGFLVNSANPPSSISATCEQISGFKPRFNDAPIVATYRIGSLIETLRLLISGILGPFASLIFLIAASLDYRAKRTNSSANRRDLFQLVLASFWLVYTIALTNFQGGYISAIDAQIVVMFFRHALALMFVILAGLYSRHRPLLWLIHGISFLVSWAVLVLDPKAIDPLYWYQVGLLMLCSWVTGYGLIRRPLDDPGTAFVRFIVLSWCFAQTFANVLLVFTGSTVFSPGFVACVLIAFTVVRFRDRLRLERDIQRTQDELKAKSRLSELAVRVSHDIRAPLGALRLVEAELLATSSDVREIFTLALSRIRVIASELLDERNLSYMNPKMERISGDSLIVRLARVVRELSAFHRQHPSLSIQLSNTGTLPACCVDLSDLDRILSNLVSNAADAIAFSGVIFIEAYARDSRLVISVRDTGRGIPADIIPKLMQEGATFGKAAGNGLGLFHARNCVERWGGKIRIDSELGKGTVVSLEFPALGP